MTSETPTFGRYAEIPYDQMTPNRRMPMIPPLYVTFQAIREGLRPAARPQVQRTSPTETSKSATAAAAE